MDIQETPCTQLKGVGPQLAEKLAKLGIHSIQDLLFHLPTHYQDHTRITPIKDLRPQRAALIEGTITQTQILFGKKRSLQCRIADQTGVINIRFFHFTTQQKTQLAIGATLRCFGEIRYHHRLAEMMHPEYRLLHNDHIMPLEETLTPIYPITQGISQYKCRNIIKQALEYLFDDTLLHEYIPKTIQDKNNLMTLKHAIQFIHNPPPDTDTQALEEGIHPSQQRLAFEELLAYQLGLRRSRARLQQNIAPSFSDNPAMIEQFVKSLHFDLTHAQERVVDEIFSDIEMTKPMLRLVQGDVGSGKTIVAAMAMLKAIANHYQAAFMAPTELLAEQHFQNFQQWFSPLNIKVVLLLGKQTVKQREAVLDIIKQNQPVIIIGTHALFQKEVYFAKLGLIVIDEQHRFGVHQRLALREKGLRQNQYPHQLIMTATPIPRTLTMTAFADMSVSIIDELPPGRQAVKTIALSNEQRDAITQRILDVCKQGRQVYWVCTLIEESETLNCQAAEATYQTLCQQLPTLNIALVHGRMKTQDKQTTMKAFKQGDIHLLVATTVIEVGVDVPNASLMIIENAERLGLSQLHQLRGRVGRGSTESFCVMLYESPLGEIAKSRLNILRNSQDGFVIAEHDLKLRGPGELLGSKQTGIVNFRIANIYRDQLLIPKAQCAADYLLNYHPEIIAPLIARWIHNADDYIAA